MNGLISVIIPKYDDDTYLIRCLNSIKQQTYQNYEILLVTKNYEPNTIEGTEVTVVNPCDEQGVWAGMNKAIEVAKGEFLFICSMNSVLSPNCLETLLESSSKYCLGTANLAGVVSGNVTIVCEPLSPLGKIFKKRILVENMIAFNEGSAYTDVLFTASYFAHANVRLSETSAYLYETEAVFSNPSIHNEVSESDVGLVYAMATLYNKNLFDKEQQYLLLEKYIVPLFKGAIENEWDDIYRGIVHYLRTVEKDKAYSHLVLSKLNIPSDLYQVMKDVSIKDFLFYQKQTYVEELSYQRNLCDLEKKLETLEKKINNAENVPMMTCQRQVNTVEENNDSILLGPSLADFVVKKYADGSLGLKTILKSITAWLRYKRTR